MKTVWSVLVSVLATIQVSYGYEPTAPRAGGCPTVVPDFPVLEERLNIYFRAHPEEQTEEAFSALAMVLMELRDSVRHATCQIVLRRIEESLDRVSFQARRCRPLYQQARSAADDEKLRLWAQMIQEECPLPTE